jgi:prophage antirepressor-like protein
MTNIINTTSPAAFDWQGTPLRTFRDAKGLVWFVAQDVCRALDLTNTARALARLDEDTKGVTTVNTPGGPQEVKTINEPGLYALIFRSNKAAAKAFQRWVTHDVLPAIRQDGLYIRGEERLLSSASPEELQARIDQLKTIAAHAIEAKATRGLCALEERETRYDTLRDLNKGRRRKRIHTPRLSGPHGI